MKRGLAHANQQLLMNAYEIDIFLDSNLPGFECPPGPTFSVDVFATYVPSFGKPSRKYTCTDSTCVKESYRKAYRFPAPSL